MFKKNTAVTGFPFGMVAKADGADVVTGTPVGYYTLDGGAQTAIADVSPVHKGNGQWVFDLTAGEMNGDVVGLTFTHAIAVTVHHTIKTTTRLVSELINAPDVSPDVTAILADTADMQPKIGAPVGVSVSADIAAVKSETAGIGAIETDTQDIQSRLPAVLISGKIDASVGLINSVSANKVADHTLRRNLATSAASVDGDTLTFRSILGAGRKLVNKILVSGGVLTIYEEDDTTSAATQSVTADASAEPITGLDTAG